MCLENLSISEYGIKILHFDAQYDVLNCYKYDYNYKYHECIANDVTHA